MKLVLVSAIALWREGGEILLARRPKHKPMGGLWEFPGGKIEPGELPEAALAREVQEELLLHVETGDLVPLTFASHTYGPEGDREGFHLLMPLYICKDWRGTVTPREGQEIAWVPVSKLHEYEMPEADRPLVIFLQHLCASVD